MLFVHLKRIFSIGWLRLNRQCGANGEVLLNATAQKLK